MPPMSLRVKVWGFNEKIIKHGRETDLPEKDQRFHLSRGPKVLTGSSLQILDKRALPSTPIRVLWSWDSPLLPVPMKLADRRSLSGGDRR